MLRGTLSKEKNKVTLVFGHRGWVDFDLGSSPGRWAAAAATCCPRRAKTFQIRCTTTRITLYVRKQDVFTGRTPSGSRSAATTEAPSVVAVEAAAAVRGAPGGAT